MNTQPKTNSKLIKHYINFLSQLTPVERSLIIDDLVQELGTKFTTKLLKHINNLQHGDNYNNCSKRKRSF